MWKWTKAVALAAVALLSQAAPCIAAGPNMVSNFKETCVAAKSFDGLKTLLAANGWKAYPSLAESHLKREIDAVTPMLNAQGLSSDYTIYRLDVGRRHFELALSETKKPIKDGRKLIGCSMYDFAATSPVNNAAIDSLAPSVAGQRSTVGDTQIEKWDNVFGDGSGMRAVFIPAGSPMGAQLGFTGMMLGTHFFNAR